MEAAVTAASDPLEEVIIWVSDLHLGEGRLPDGRANPLEEFEKDEEFFRFIAHIVGRFKHTPKVRLKLGGAVVVFQSVLFMGRNDDTPYEAVHRYKIKKIIRAHRRFFDALAMFLSEPGRTMDIFIGNHDFGLEWAGVQRIIMKRIAKECPGKVRFLYSEDYRGVHYFHGNFEPHSATNQEEKYITQRFGVKLKRPLLNYPYGTFMTVEATNRLKLRNPLIGRLRVNDYIWRDSLLRDWAFGLYALALYVWIFIYNRFFGFWALRRKARLSTTVKLMLWTITGYDLKEYARRIFEERPEIKVVVSGHEHEAMRVTMSRGADSGTYLNSGTWTKIYDIVDQAPSYRWKILRPVERVLRRVQKFLHRPQVIAVSKLTFVMVEHHCDGTLNARLLEFRPYAQKEKRVIEVI